VINKFNNYISINEEATIDDSKSGIEYEFSRNGQNYAKRFDISPNLTFVPIDYFPNDDIDVLHVRPSSVKVVEFGKLKTLLNINSESDINKVMIYESTSKKYPFVVVKKGTKTTMLRQKGREGVTKRAEHFRETVFIITFASTIWEMTGHKVDIYTNRGKVEMDYLLNDEGKRFAMISEKERGEFRRRYEEFAANKGLYNSMLRQSKELVGFLGKNVNNVDSIYKNSSDLLISRMAKAYLDEEIDFYKSLDPSDKENWSYKFPETVNISKWNPSDMWITFKDGKDLIYNPDWYNDIENLDELNNSLYDFILQKNGLIGVSLKQQQTGESRVRKVNMLEDDVQHQFLGYKSTNSIKTVTVKFGYRFSKNSKFYRDGELQLRTFDTSPVSAISVEVKGSKKAQHMSGKAGSLLSTVVPNQWYSLIEKIRKEKDMKKIKEILSTHNFHSPDLTKLVKVDLESETKTQEINSRLQSYLVLDWLLSESSVKRNRFVSTIVKFAKSESLWSSPHLVVK
jgi:hypothetical protein